MIELVKNYKIILREYQVKQLYDLLKMNKERLIGAYPDLRDLYTELGQLHDDY